MNLKGIKEEYIGRIEGGKERRNQGKFKYNEIVFFH